VQQPEDRLTVEIQLDPADRVAAQLAQAVHTVITPPAQRRLAGVRTVEDRILGPPVHHRCPQVQIRSGAREAVRFVVAGTLLGVGGDHRPGLRQHRAALDLGEHLVEVGGIVTELLQGALAAGVQSVESALGESDVEGPVLSS